MRILVADDDVTSRLVLKAVVTNLGHECLVAEEGSRAWELLSSNTIDVLLTDWMMPGLDGPELCRRVRDELSGGYTYVVLVTGLGQHDQVLQGMGAGADDYLIKPVDPFDVETRLVAAERVTALHRQVSDYRARLERANHELLGLSLTDALTGVGNRRGMEDDLARTHARAQRSGQPFSVALFDIDHFKLYNDHYGHIGGDEALRVVASRFAGAVRQHEAAYRYGGEEFLLLFPGQSVGDAAAAAERVRKAIEDAAIPHKARPTPPALVTVTGAAAGWTAGCNLSVPDLLNRADQALYEAKAAGRNRVHIAAPSHSREEAVTPAFGSS